MIKVAFIGAGSVGFSWTARASATSAFTRGTLGEQTSSRSDEPSTFAQTMRLFAGAPPSTLADTGSDAITPSVPPVGLTALTE